jgi:quercetin dioxygenase-like cupin family protein
MTDDPVITNPELYRVVLENERVRVLEFRDTPGAMTAPHRHPDSLMLTLSSFRRLLTADGRQAKVRLGAGEIHWLAAHEHCGENTGDTDTHVLFIEIKQGAAGMTTKKRAGPEMTKMPLAATG